MKSRNKVMEKILIICMVLPFILVSLTGCDNKESENVETEYEQQNDNTSMENEFTEDLTTRETVTQDKETTVDVTTKDEETTAETTEEFTTEDVTEESTFEEETPEEATTENITTKETTSQKATTEKKTTEKKTTKRQETTKKQEVTTEEETTTSIEDIEDGMLWRYRTDFYADDPIKSELEQIFWDEFGWTTFCKKKNDELVIAMVELVYDIMQNNDTEIMRELALYDAICISCRYDYESLETGLTPEGQTPYGVLIEHKAVCGGYACTFALGLTMMGIQNELIHGLTTEGLHAWNQVCLDDEWYQVDVTWGDGDEGFSYRYFNRTSEDMSNTHEVRNNICTGTKYNEKYLENMYKEEFLADKVYIETVDACIKYIVSQVENGNDDMMIYVPSEIFDELYDVFDDYAIWESICPLSDSVKEKYINYYNSGARYTYHKKVKMSSISEIHIYFELNKYATMENFVEDYDESEMYIDNQVANGAQEILVYYAGGLGGIHIPKAPEGMEWIVAENDTVPGTYWDCYSRLWDKYLYYFILKCVEKEQ